MTTVANEVNVCSNSSEIMSTDFQNIKTQKHDILEKWIVILLKTNANGQETADENLIKKHCDVAGDIELFSCVDKCIDFLTDVNDRKICLILCTSLTKSLVPMIHDFSQLKFIYVLRDNENYDILLTNKWTKIKGSFSDMVNIFHHFKQNIRQSVYDLLSISIACPSNVNNTNELDSSFMYSQLLKDIILKMQYNKTSKTDFVDYLRAQYANNLIGLESINTFDQEYDSQSPIWWYSKENFIYEPLNRALRTQNTEIIVHMGFYIQGLHQEICRLHKEQQPREKMLLYRGQAMIQNDFEKLQRNKNGLLSFNTFLSTSTDKIVSHLYAESASSQDNSVGILFQIEIDPSILSSPFAAVKNISQFESEEETLFSMHTIFRIGEIKNIEGKVWQVNLILTDDNDEQLKQVTEYIRQQIKIGSANKSLGYLLFSMGRYNNAEKIYNKMLRSTPDNDIRSLLDLYNMLGGIAHAKSNYSLALSYFQKILDMCPLPSEYDDFNLADVYNNMALINHLMGDDSTASELYDIVAEMREKSLSCNSFDLGTVYNNIAIVNTSMGQHSIALKYFQKSLHILEHSLPSAHPDLASIYSNIGMINNVAGEREVALQYFKKALEVQKKSLPPTHISMIGALSNLATTYHWIGQYQTAMEYYKDALKIFDVNSLSEYSDLAVVYNNIGQLYKTWGQYDNALMHYLKALNIQEKMLSSANPKLALFYINVGLMYNSMGRFSMAMKYLENGLKIQEESLPSTHRDFARTYISIGIVYQAKEDFLNALYYYEKALNIQKIVFSSTHPDLASIYTNIAGVELSLRREYSALNYIEKALHIFEQHLPPMHPEIG